jgi:transposase-like protein
MSIPKLDEIWPHFHTERSCILWLLEEGIVEIPECCGKPMRLTNRSDKPYLAECKSGRVCRTRQSIFKNTFFGNSMLPCNTIMKLCYLWLAGIRHTQIRLLIGLSPNTITDWVKYLLDLITQDLEDLTDNDVKLGGEGIIVEIDETKIAKRKYHRGHRVRGAWVIGGVEWTEARKFFAMRVPDRSSETILEVIQKFVHPGSIIYTDCWAGYETEELENLGFQHLTVNHSDFYVDPETGVHTNNIEGTWAGLKLLISKRHRSGPSVDGYLDAFTWRRWFKNGLWDRLLLIIQSAKYNN